MRSDPVSKKKVALDLDLVDRRPRLSGRREVLVVGEMRSGERAELVARGAQLQLAETIEQAFRDMLTNHFDVVVVNPLVQGCGLDFVNAVKEGPVEHQLTLSTLFGDRGTTRFLKGVRPPPVEELEQIRERHRNTPVVVLPVFREFTYSVIVVPPDASFIRDMRRYPVVTTILSVDARQLVGTAEPMA